MTAPPHRDHISAVPVGFVENSCDGSLVDDDRFRARPSSCQRTTGRSGILVRGLIECRQENRAAIGSTTLPRNDSPNVCLSRPGNHEDSRNSRTRLRGSITRHHDAKIGRSCDHLGYQSNERTTALVRPTTGLRRGELNQNFSLKRIRFIVKSLRTHPRHECIRSAESPWPRPCTSESDTGVHTLNVQHEFHPAAGGGADG